MNKLVDRCKEESDDLRLALTHANYALCDVHARPPNLKSAKHWIREVKEDLSKAHIPERTFELLQSDISEIIYMLSRPPPSRSLQTISDMIRELQAAIDHEIVKYVVLCAAPDNTAEKRRRTRDRLEKN